ncbi:DUF3019 domain-containing protein [Thalassotalea agarivorans]|uniref:DUF3019 domain-containing protein n=1 Tax=Thalassotalea agarivorans TaxID=349064 RepID=A0A1I0CXU7_THASX|nr:DUF3019 domain-containing protein [Thalassotalea agarivorans]SET24504.1 Protein of unknown function [Thalassotalea agarivorans]
MMQRLLTLISLASLFAYSQTSIANDDVEIVTANISPDMCVASNETQTCNITLAVNLTFTEPEAVCVVIKQLDIVYCGNESVQFVYSRQLLVKEALEVAIYNKSQSQVLYRKVLNVGQYQPNKTRNRRHLGWIL